MSTTERKMKKHTNLPRSPAGIKKYLAKFRKAVLEGKYIISKNQNRQENIDFIENYKIDTKKEKEILLGIQFDDFCYAADNEKEEFAHEKLYIFCKSQALDCWGIVESVDIYIKINMTKTRRGEDFTIVVSFHKRNRLIEYMFK